MKRWICLGDSLTDSDRLFSPNGLGSGYVNQLNQRLNRPEKHVEIINRGVDGFTVNRLLENVGRDCIDRNPDIVTILIGINDVCLIADSSPARQQAMLDTFEYTYRELIRRIRRYTNSDILLMEPFLFPYPREFVNWIPYVSHISEQIAAIAADFDCSYILLHDRLNKAAEEEGFAALTIDGVHLTSRGHEILSDALYPYFIQHTSPSARD